MNQVALHVAPHAHPFLPLFPGRFGGENHVLNAILHSAKKHADLTCYVLALGPEDVQVELGENSYLVEVKKHSQVFGDEFFLSDLDRLTDVLVKLIASLQRTQSKVSVTFHYWDGAYVFRASATEFLNEVLTVFVSHSLQATHIQLGGEYVAAPQRVAIESERFAFENADRCWLMSNYERQIAEEVYLRTSHRALTVAGHIVLPNRERLTTRSPLRKVTVLCHGRDTERKNLRGFVRAATGLEANQADITVKVGLKVEPIVSERNVSWEFVPFLPREAYLENLDSAQIFVMPSLYEPFGLVALEAFLAGKILIAPTFSAVQEFKKDEGVILVNTGNSDTLAFALSLAIEAARVMSFQTTVDPKKAPDLIAELLTVSL